MDLNVGRQELDAKKLSTTTRKYEWIQTKVSMVLMSSLDINVVGLPLTKIYLRRTVLVPLLT